MHSRSRRPERIRRNRPPAGPQRIGARHPLDGRRRALHHPRSQQHPPLQLRLRRPRRKHAPRARAEPRHYGLRFFTRRTGHPDRLGPQADLPPLLYDHLFARARQRRTARTARCRIPARRLLLARRPENRLLRPQRPLCLRHRHAGYTPHHRRRSLEHGHFPDTRAADGRATQIWHTHTGSTANDARIGIGV